ncbi:FAD-binding oxidoreductase [Maribacter sp. 2-571]|uniref:FAD-binding oxidoreductase n=1 Tax=Maribacter sp. 2-571 TaxID=3417569 RepID=UPI003D345293
MRNSSSKEGSLMCSLAKIVGADYVKADYDFTTAHSKNTLPRQQLAKVIVRPLNKKEIAKIFVLAKKNNAKVWCFSGGNNWGYGSKNALEKDAIVLLLDRMNKIIEVNTELAYAVIEPGVTQQQLNDHLTKLKTNLWIDCTDSTPKGSLLGNAVERGIGYTPYGDHFGNVCGMEVVLPNGEILHQDEAKKSKTFHTHKWAHGPFLDGLFSQSNMGIVTKIGIWLMPKPKHTQLFILDLKNKKVLPKVIDVLRTLSLQKIVQGHPHMVNDFQMLTVIATNEDLSASARQGNIEESVLKELYRKYRIAPWAMVGSIYAESREEMGFRKKQLKKSFRDFGKLSFFDAKKVRTIGKFVTNYERSGPGSYKRRFLSWLKPLFTDKPIASIALLPEMFNVVRGVPTWKIIKSAYFKNKSPGTVFRDPAADNCGIIWLAPTFPTTGEHAMQLLRIFQDSYEKYRFNFCGCITKLNDRTSFFLSGIFFDKNNKEEAARAMALHSALVKTIYDNGYPPYRSGLMSWGLEEHRQTVRFELLKILKKALDPSECYAPDRYGISYGKR